MKCGGGCKSLTKPRSKRRPLGHILLLSLALLLQLVLPACRGQATPSADLIDSNPLLKRLSDLSFDAMTRLGPHHMTGTLVATAESESRTFTSSESYDLKWESERRYAYRILKDERPTMNVVILGTKAFQIRLDGKATPRPNTHDFHYYLQQTWNLWSTAVTPFGDNLTLTPVGESVEGGRPRDQYAIALKEEAPALDQGTRGSVETRLTDANGVIDIDRGTSVPLSINFEGIYETLRFSRVPGKEPRRTTHRVTLELERNELGKSQAIAAPDLAAPSSRVGSPSRQIGERPPLSPAGRQTNRP